MTTSQLAALVLITAVTSWYITQKFQEFKERENQADRNKKTTLTIIGTIITILVAQYFWKEYKDYQWRRKVHTMNRSRDPKDRAKAVFGH